MLEAIAGFGQALSQEEDPLAILAQTVRQPQDKDKAVYLIQLDLRDEPTGPLLAPLPPIKIDDDVCIRYRWIGNVVGRSPQTYLTTNRLDYLVGDSVLNLIVQLEKADLKANSLYRDLFWILGTFYRCLPNNKPILDLEKLNIVEEGFIDSAWDKSKGKAKTVLNDAAAALQKKLLADLGLKTPQAALWTLSFNGRPLTADPIYDQYVLYARNQRMGE